MVQFFEQLIRQDGSFFSAFLVLSSALILARIAPLPRHWQPMIWLGQLAKDLAIKVNHTERAVSQQITAGILAAILLVIPFWAICTFLLQLAAFPWFFEFLVLYFSLSDACFKQVALETHDCLQQQDKASARQLLKPWVAQDTASLSEIGICKTTIEKLAASPAYGVVATIIYFALGGAPLVLAVRMIKQLELAWPVINPKYQHFGKVIEVVSIILLFVPNALWGLTLAILSGPAGLKAWLASASLTTPFRLTYQTYFVTASSLNVELGGPRKYLAERVNLPVVHRAPKPIAKDILAAEKLTSNGFSIWLSFVILLPVLWATLRYLQT